MNILLIGNGFDLAHDLPTKYSHFLEFIKALKNFLVNKRFIEDGHLDKLHYNIQELFCGFEMNLEESLREGGMQWEYEAWRKLVEKNFWIDHFLEHYNNTEGTWIDFESEISYVIKSIDAGMRNGNLCDAIGEFVKASLESCYGSENLKDNSISYLELRNKLLDSLDHLVQLLECYLGQYVGRMQTNYRLPDIQGVTFDKVLSFNYTNTYERIYGQEKDIEYNYIHGKARVYKDMSGYRDAPQPNNMVLGINEYLTDDERNKNLEFIAFKKFYQRIHKETGCKYREWLDEITRKETNERSYLYIFGHSLDVTDGDILRDLILSENLDTIIYYLDRDVYGKQIANLVKTIGQDELIKRTGGSTKTIEFRQQATALR